MAPARYLRIASGITVLFAAGHVLGGTESWSPPGDTAVLQSMRSFTFDVMGSRRSYAEFYLGFGFYIGVMLLLQAVLLWQVAALAALEARRGRAMVVALLAATLVGTVVLGRFMFIVPTLFSAAIGVCLAMAWFESGRVEAGAAGSREARSTGGGPAGS